MGIQIFSQYLQKKKKKTLNEPFNVSGDIDVTFPPTLTQFKAVPVSIEQLR